MTQTAKLNRGLDDNAKISNTVKQKEQKRNK